MGLVYENSRYNIGLYTEGLSGYWKCEKCGKRLRTCAVEFVMNNKEKTRYYIPKILSREHECDK
jgi:tRNA(Ile2) C34 agmatinyltransferase TiaS